MGRALIVIHGNADRERARHWVQQAPAGTRIQFNASKRTLPQNQRMWAMLTDIATQALWHGQKLAPADWKLIFMDALNRELRAVPNLAGTGFVNLGRSSSKLSKSEMSDLMELMAAWGAENGVKFNELEG